MNHYWVYILRCADYSYYTGVTNELERRLEEHQAGKNEKAYTHNRRPVELVFSAIFNDINQAIAFEKQVKGWSRKKKEAIINDQWEKLPGLSVCNNVTSHKNYKRPPVSLSEVEDKSGESNVSLSEVEDIPSQANVSLSEVEDKSGESNVSLSEVEDIPNQSNVSLSEVEDRLSNTDINNKNQ